MELFRSGKKVEEDVEQFYRNVQGERGEAAGAPEQEGTSPPRPAYAYEEPASETPQWRASATTGSSARPGVVIARDANLEGKLQAEGNIHVEGRYQGELHAQDTVFIAEDAVVEAEVAAAEVVVAGKLQGTVRAERRFHALPTAQVACQVTSTALVIDEGAEVNCTFTMQG